MSEIRILKGIGEIDENARLRVEESMTAGQCITIGGFGPVKTGFGTRLHVPLGETQMKEDPGIFGELTYEQALDLNAKLAVLLVKLAAKR